MAGDDEPSSNDWGPLDEDEHEDWSSFLVPPPPPPPSLGPSVCSDLYCRVGGQGGPMGAHFDRASFPSLPIVAVCSSVVLVAVLVASFLFWRHKSKVQNLLPCKNEQQGHLGDMGAANGVTYEDILAGHHPSRLTQGHLAGSQALMPLEILDVKLGEIGPPHITAMHHVPCYPPPRDAGHLVGGGKPFHHPVYEEVSQAPCGDIRSGNIRSGDIRSGGRSLTSDEDFADEDLEGGSGQCSATSSVRGSTGGDLCRDPVSSDGEDCESYMINNLPKIVPGDNTFGYNPRHPNSKHHRGQQQTYPLPERTAVQRVTEPGGFRSHSSNNKNKPNNSGRHVSPSHIPSTTFPVDPRSAQWMTTHGQYQQQHQQDGFPVSASQENIYSTIDEDEDYPAPLTSLACSQKGGGSPLGKPPMVKGAHGPRGDGRPAPPPLSQRNPEENGGSSYGDIMPAFHSASFM